MSGRIETDRLIERLQDLDESAMVTAEDGAYVMYSSDDPEGLLIGDESEFRVWAHRRLGL